MIALYILLGILLLLFLICLIRVQIFAEYTDDIKVKLKILFYETLLVPQVEKPEKPPKKKEEKKPEPKPEEEKKQEKEKKPSYLSRLKDKKGVTGIIELFKELAKIAAGALKGIFKHIVIKRLIVGIALNSGDAASTAIAYGELCSAVYPSVNVITSICICKDYNVTLEPIFDDERPTEVYVNVHAYIRVGFVLLHALKAGVKLLIARLKL